MLIELNDFLIPTDYAKHIGKSITWVNQLIRDKKLPYILHNGRKLIPKSGIMPDYIKVNNHE